MKIGNTHFNPQAVKKMTMKQFKEQYGGILRGCDVDAAYFQITGKKPRKSKKHGLEGEND